MRCILVFDHLNDVIFSKCDREFVSHIRKLGSFQGMDTNGIQGEDGNMDLNFVIQLFSPIVTSQRIMSSQFGNSYTSIQCQDGLNVVFDEYLGYLFVHLGFSEINWLKRVLAVCVSIMQHLCGPDLSVLKTDLPRYTLIGRLLDTWTGLAGDDQGFLLEAIEQLTVNSELNMVAIKALREATDKMKSMLDRPKSHAVIFVENKFLSLYSSKSARDLSAKDLLFLSVMSVWCQKETSSLPKNNEQTGSTCSSFYSTDASPVRTKNGPLVDGSGSASNLVLLSADDSSANCPYIIHISALSDGVTLVLLCQTPYDALSIGLNCTFDALHRINLVSMSNTETDGVKRGVEILESAVKKVYEAMKKLKGPDTSPTIDATWKLLQSKWEILKKHWAEYKKNGNSSTSVVSCCQNLSTTFRELLRLTVLNKSPIAGEQVGAHIIRQMVSNSLAHFKSFLHAKAQRNFTLGSREFLDINKYLEGFPGLVHFIYVDRVNHRITAPSCDFSTEKPGSLTKEQVWSMVELSRNHLQEGHLAIMWRDSSFSYAYYLWFEDMSGSPLQPKISVQLVVKILPLPGVISSDFYQRLVKTCFPKMDHSKIRCFELYCIHSGGATSSSVLEQSHRLASTICEVSGMPSNPLDIL
ncbi:Hermansky-Pudlak Syndrome 1 [Nesidiocoris tenuis]|uniref:Hermansky-Pudlak Syndrome 1 n=1 Tax=Nesidiocoris tenuis TaxID=355587 RepID=A0ABN7B5F5_9HEMI|nr:Hermansky-Pudlak Syndrome 1 [Nesidiocoris tenuis]